MKRAPFRIGTYTPELLRSLLAWKGDTCAIPDCNTPLNRGSIEGERRDWRVCDLHWRSLSSYLAVQDWQYLSNTHEGFQWKANGEVPPVAMQLVADVPFSRPQCVRCDLKGNFNIALPPEWIRVNGQFEEVPQPPILTACPFHVRELRAEARRRMKHSSGIFYGWVNPDIFAELLAQIESSRPSNPRLIELLKSDVLDADACFEGFHLMQSEG